MSTKAPDSSRSHDQALASKSLIIISSGGYFAFRFQLRPQWSHIIIETLLTLLLRQPASQLRKLCLRPPISHLSTLCLVTFKASSIV